MRLGRLCRRSKNFDGCFLFPKRLHCLLCSLYRLFDARHSLFRLTSPFSRLRPSDKIFDGSPVSMSTYSDLSRAVLGMTDRRSKCLSIIVQRWLMDYRPFDVTSLSSTIATSWYIVVNHGVCTRLILPPSMPEMATHHGQRARDETFAIYRLCDVDEDDVDKVTKNCDAGCKIEGQMLRPPHQRFLKG